MSNGRFLVLGALLFSAVPLTAQEPDGARAMKLARDAATAADAQDNATYLAKMEEAVALRPDFPRMLINLAAAQVANEKLDDALATLERFAVLGLNSPVDKVDAFAPLKDRKEFKEVVKKIAANAHAKGAGDITFSLRDVTGLPEGIAWREKTDQFYFGDVNGRAVWVRNKDKEGTLRRLTPEGDELFGVFGLAIDEASGTLWAATAAVAAMRGFTSDMDGTAALAEIDLESGAVRRVIPVVRRAGDLHSHVLGDLALGPDGSVFLTDSGGPMLWRLAPGGSALEPWLEHAEFMSLQGIAVSGDGAALIVADHVNGLLRVDLARRSVTRLAAPEGTTLIGLDGITLAPTGELYAIQNGLRPSRVLKVELDASAENVSAVTVVESGHLTMAAPSLGCIGTGGHYYFIGNAGWTRFENTDGAPSTPRSVPVFRVKITPPKPAK